MATQQPENKPDNLPPLFLNYHATSNISVAKIAVLTFYDFFEWWYIEMPIIIYRYIARISMVMLDRLSILILLRTFFVPWHRHRKPVGYFMGITMRILYIPVAILIYISVMFISILVLFGWILLPILTFIMIFATPFID